MLGLVIFAEVNGELILNALQAAATLEAISL